MTDSQQRAAKFETHRPHLLAVATRLLGSPTEAEDAVQEAWLRLDRAGDAGIENLGAWLTTVVSRICLDHLRSRTTRAEDPVDSSLQELSDSGEPGPEDTAMLTESTAEALAVVLETLAPIERVAFVLHDVFDVPFEEIAAVVDRTPAATRQLASRARRRVRTANNSEQKAKTPRQEIVAAFFAASKEGRLGALIQLLAPDVVLRPDATTLAMGIRTGWLTSELRGPEAVAEQFAGQAQAAQLAIIDGQPGAVWAPGGKPFVVFRITVDGDTIAAIDLIADPKTIETLTIEINASE